MANVDAITYTNQTDAAANAASMVANAALISGKPKFIQFEFTVPAGTDENDVIRFGYLPSGVTIVPGLVTTTVATSCGAFTIELSVSDEDGDTVLGTTADLSNLGSANLGASLTAGSITTDKRSTLTGVPSDALTEGGKVFVNVLAVDSN